ncbi:MAG: hypothetical protein Kow00121_36900 [Elainellaceae cyanobacterium]
MLQVKRYWIPPLLTSLFTASCQKNSLDRTLNLPGTCGSKEIDETLVFDKGNMFLISIKNDRIQQVQRDIKADANIFEQLSKNDPEIRDFVEKSSQQ